MYLTHFGLLRNPFDPCPDPDLFYPSAVHREALQALLRGIEMRAGFMVLSGRPGLGKTSVLRSAIERIDSERVRVVSIEDPDVTYRQLLEAIYRNLGVELPASPGLIDLGHHLYRVLLGEYEQGRNVVLMIDDAQKMPVRTLACIQHLRNLEKDGRKLIQVILAGREPELGNILKLGRLKQLRQEVAFRAAVSPLSRDESLEYVRFRVTTVAGVKRFPFTQTALKQIVEHCGGNPRHLNLFCERALEAGWQREENQVGLTTVRDVVAGLLSIDFEETKGKTRSSVGIAIALMASLWVVTLGLTVFRGGRLDLRTSEIAAPPPGSPVKAVEAPTSGAGWPGGTSAIESDRTTGSRAKKLADPTISGTGVGTDPSYPPKIGHPRIDRLPGEVGSETFWIYGPRDLSRQEGGRAKTSSRQASGEPSRTPDTAPASVGRMTP